MIPLSVIGTLGAGTPPNPTPENLMPPTVTWDSPSVDARGSMPLGNGDIGINAWVEPSGDLLFYIGKTDAWEDNARLAKLGLVRLSLSPPLPVEGTRFVQELRPAQGEIVITATRPAPPDGKATATIELRLWVDANHPVIHLEVDSPDPVRAAASFELWRTSPTALPSIEVSDVLVDRDQKSGERAPTVVEPDTVLSGIDSGIGWYHRNIKSVGPEITMRHQDLLEAPWTDPLLHRVFGAWIRGPGTKRIDGRHLESAPARRHLFQVHVLTLHPATAVEWTAAVDAAARRIEATDLEDLRAAHLGWWDAFWSRSHIVVSARSSAGTAAAEAVTRGYALQRFIIACGGRGLYPIRFNGSIFTVPWPDQPGDADYRRWGSPGFWWQNTRLSYVPLCTSGDFDLLDSLNRMYTGEVLAVSKYRTQRYFGLEDAAYLPECIYPWGAVFSAVYGWMTTAAERADKLQVNGYHKWEWVAGPELVFMLLDQYDHTGDETLLRETILPTALPVIRFFDLFYPTGPDGKLVMHPSQALETWWDCTNPMSEVAGLHAIIGRLLNLPEALLPPVDRAYLEQVLQRLPALPVREVEGVRMLAAADRFADKRNIENPELYAVFPFRLVSFEKPNAALGLEALHHRTDRGAFGWRQDDIFMAYLGLAEEARAAVVERALAHDPACRFPAFWGPNYDWTPDQDHGGVLLKALQAMLLQSEGDRIFLLPAWPGDWDVDFKLHAPRRTLLEGRVESGRLTRLRVTPASREKDVVLSDRFRP